MPKVTLIPCRITSAHVDWLTCTASDPASQQRLWDLALRRLNACKHENETPPRWHGHGYSGWQGPGVRLGSRADSTIVQLSGAESAEHWQEAVRASENTTRIDLAVDASFDPPAPRLARQLYRKIGPHKTSGRKTKRTIWASSDGGETLYIGARSSENFGRLYDKGIEQKVAQKGCWWRWEVELKGETARTVVDGMVRHRVGGAEIARGVSAWFGRRVGAAPAPADDSVVHNVCSEPTTADRQLQWLTSSVRPTVQRLLESQPLERVLFALGLLGEVDRLPLERATTQLEGDPWLRAERFTR